MAGVSGQARAEGVGQILGWSTKAGGGRGGLSRRARGARAHAVKAAFDQRAHLRSVALFGHPSHLNPLGVPRPVERRELCQVRGVEFRRARHSTILRATCLTVAKTESQLSQFRLSRRTCSAERPHTGSASPRASSGEGGIAPHPPFDTCSLPQAPLGRCGWRCMLHSIAWDRVAHMPHIIGLCSWPPLVVRAFAVTGFAR